MSRNNDDSYLTWLATATVIALLLGHGWWALCGFIILLGMGTGQKARR